MGFGTRTEVTALDTQNEVKLIKPGQDAQSGRIALSVRGDLDSGDVEIGEVTDADDIQGTFEPFTDGTLAAAGSIECAWGDDVYARATGSSPNVTVRVTRVN